MIKPTVGRIVWYWLAAGSPQTEPLAAIVAAVKSDSRVNLSVIDAEGTHRPEQNVELIQDGDGRPSTHFCEWMPYQKGQAAKTEAIQQQKAQDAALERANIAQALAPATPGY